MFFEGGVSVVHIFEGLARMGRDAGVARRSRFTKLIRQRKWKVYGNAGSPGFWRFVTDCNGLKHNATGHGQCISSQQNATDCNIGPPERRLQTAQNPVVEHKGWDAWFGFCRVFAFNLFNLGRDAFQRRCIPLGMRRQFRTIDSSRKAPGVPFPIEGRINMAQRTIRFSEATDKGIQEAARKRGFSSPTAFARHSVEQELSGRSDELVGAEERLAASIEQVRREVFRLGRGQQALFAFVDSLAKVLLTCLPEPSGEAVEPAVARARNRHARLVKSAGQSMVGDSQAAMRDLAAWGEG